MATARIKFYKRNKSLENGRQQEKEPTLFYEAWCEIRNLYGQELYEALDVRLENAIVFEVRYCRRIKEIKAHAKDLRKYSVVWKPCRQVLKSERSIKKYFRDPPILQNRR